MAEPMKRVLYAGAVHDRAEIDAVLAVLDAGPQALKIGVNVDALEKAVAAMSGKRRGLMVNSGSSALYVAVELLDLPVGSEVITSPVTFSTDLVPLVRAGLVPVFVDVEADTFNLDASGIEDMVTPRTRDILAPDLAGNAPDWDAIRAVADRHGHKVIEDSCDALGAKLHGTPTGTRADISPPAGCAPPRRPLKKLPEFTARRQRTFEQYREMLGQHPDVFIAPRTLEGLETVWMVCLAMVRPDSGVSRSGLQEYLEARGSTPARCGPATPPASPSSKTSPTASRRAGCPTPTGSWSGASRCRPATV
jgi:dTDP-4-amino-4,6-dideoxygalactose transaminase